MSVSLTRRHRLVALVRYRVRVASLKIRGSQLKRLDLVQLALALLGLWTLLYAGFRRLSTWTGSPYLATVIVTGLALIAALCLTVHHARHPETIFRQAARTESRARQLAQMMRSAQSNPAALDMLLALYLPIIAKLPPLIPNTDVDVPLDANRRQSLVVTLKPKDGLRLDHLLKRTASRRSDSWHRRTSSFAGDRQSFMATLRSAPDNQNSFGDEEGRNLILDEVRSGSDLELVVAEATYGQIVRTSDSLINEFNLFSYISSRTAWRSRERQLSISPSDVLSCLPWRKEIHALDPGTQLFLTPRGRAAGLGVSVVITYEQAGKKLALIGRRSLRVGTYPDVYHVLPSGMINLHGPLVDTTPESLSELVEATMLAEMLEECFDMDEFSERSLGAFNARVVRALKEKELHDLHPEGTGLAIDLLNLRTEICARIDVSTRQEVLNALRTSWEYSLNESLQSIDLDSPPPTVDRGNFVQSGLGAIALAREASASG